MKTLEIIKITLRLAKTPQKIAENLQIFYDFGVKITICSNC